MITRSLSRANDATFRQLDDDCKKYWLSFHDLYPCIIEDPIQIYLRYHRGMAQQTDMCLVQHKQNERMNFYLDRRDSMIHVSSVLSYSNYRKFEKHLPNLSSLERQDGFVSVPIFNSRLKLKSFADALVSRSSSWVQSHIPQLYVPLGERGSAPLVLVIFTDVTKIEDKNIYRVFQIYFWKLLLTRLYKYVDQDTICYFHTASRSVVRVVSMTDMSPVFQSLDIEQRFKSYCKWVRQCRSIGYIYELYPQPSHAFLYPNMKISSDSKEIEDFKNEYAREIGEVTLLWRCQPRHREMAGGSFLNPSFDVKALNLSPRYEMIVDNMIRLYKSNGNDNVYVPENRPPVYCTVMTHFENDHVSLFVDFETVDDFIYLIGIGCYINSRFEYRYIMCESLTSDEQNMIMTEFVTFLHSLRYTPHHVYYWFAEKRFWNKVEGHPEIDFSNWTDLCQWLQDVPVIVKGCFNFKLKSVIHHMVKNGMIDTTTLTVPDDACNNGQKSMDVARKFFDTGAYEYRSLLLSYNEFDCKAMFCILHFLASVVDAA